jgi:hypothetical protein
VTKRPWALCRSSSISSHRVTESRTVGVSIVTASMMAKTMRAAEQIHRRAMLARHASQTKKRELCDGGR